MAWLPCQIGPATPAWPTLRAALSVRLRCNECKIPRRPRCAVTAASSGLFGWLRSSGRPRSDSLASPSRTGLPAAGRGISRGADGPRRRPGRVERPRSVKWPAPLFIVGKPSTKLAARPWRARLTGDLVPIGTRVGRPDGPIHGARREKREDAAQGRSPTAARCRREADAPRCLRLAATADTVATSNSAVEEGSGAPRTMSSKRICWFGPINSTDSAVPENVTPVGKNGLKAGGGMDGVTGGARVASRDPVSFTPLKTSTCPSASMAE